MSISLFLLLGCEKELYEDSIKNTNDIPYTAKKITYEELKNNKILLDKLDNIEEINNNTPSTSSKIVFVPQHDFYIDTDLSNYIESLDGNYHSYTFDILNTADQDSLNSGVKNLVLSFNTTKNDYDVYVVSYDVNALEKEKIINNQFVDLEGKSSIKLLKDFDTETVLNSLVVIIDVDNGTVTCWNEVYGTSAGTGWQNQVVSYSQVDCQAAFNGGGGGGGGGSNTDSGSGSTGSTGSTGGSTSGGSTPSGSYGSSGSNTSGGNVTTTPIATNQTQAAIGQVQRLKNLNTNFSWSVKTFLNNNPSITQEINTYLESQVTNPLDTTYPNIEIVFINQVLAQIMANPTLFTSVIPFIIEKKIDDSELDPCSKEILDNLKVLQNKDIKNILSRLNNPITAYNTKIKTEQFPGFDLGQTTHPTNNNFIIKIRTNYVDGTDHEPNSTPTTLSIASTIIHEIIHAHLHSLYDDYNNGISSEFCNFPLLFEAYVSHTYPGGNPVDAHHEEMLDKFVNIIASALQEFHTGLPVSDYESLDQVYTDLALSTFSGTPIFNFKYSATGTASVVAVRTRILNRRFAEARNQPIGDQNPIGTPCN